MLINLNILNSFQEPVSNQVDELGSVVVVAAELKDPATEGKKEPVVPRPAPPTTALRSALLSFSTFLLFCIKLQDNHQELWPDCAG